MLQMFVAKTWKTIIIVIHSRHDPRCSLIHPVIITINTVPSKRGPLDGTKSIIFHQINQ